MISVTILTKNSERTLARTLDSLKPFSEVILLDTGSNDKTLEIAKSYPNARIHKMAFIGFGPLHNLASSLASHDWILSIDSDEILTEPLANEIANLALNPEEIYLLKRANYLNGKRIRGCGGWSPDSVARLYHRQKSAFTEDLVHERVKSSHLKKVHLKHTLIHTPYLETRDFLSKMQQYTALFAQQTERASSPFWKILLHSWFAFFKSYILKGGFLMGKEGYIISAYNSHTTFYKYLKLKDL